MKSYFPTRVMIIHKKEDGTSENLFGWLLKIELEIYVLKGEDKVVSAQFGTIFFPALKSIKSIPLPSITFDDTMSDEFFDRITKSMEN